MLTEKQFEVLKKTNLSVDAQKSKDRISADFKKASADMKKKAIELSGLTRSTFYNAFQKGSASPKIVLAMAQTLGVSPYYYTGEHDKKDELSADILDAFLKEKSLSVTEKPKTTKAKAKAKPKAKVKAKAAEPAKKRGRKPAVKTAVKAAKPAQKAPKLPKTPSAPVKSPKAPAGDEVFIQVSIPKSLKLQKAVTNLDEESAVLLLRALIRKADASDNAKALCDIIKSCLLS
jgi:hypothetical protein